MTTTATEPQEFEFQAQTRQLLDIVIHSLYSHKEIFLRELISNASDALDRLRFEALTRPELLDGAEILEVRLDPAGGARTLTVLDNGIGMSREEVIANLGTIAQSGTRELVSRLQQGGSAEAAADLIGQFGVGFYSAFMVADRVSVITRRAGEDRATRWESSGDGTFTVADDHRFLRGTTVTLHLKPPDPENGLEDYTDPQVLRRLVQRYSDFVTYPIVMKEEREAAEVDAAGNPLPRPARRAVEEVTLNSRRPIWTRPPSEVTDGELAEFYRHLTHDRGEPLDTLALKAEGRIEYQALLFIPDRPPLDAAWRDPAWGLRLYVRRVLVLERCQELLPPHLRFLRGVVDSPDLPLNISREMVQQDRHIGQIRRWLARKVLDHLDRMRQADGERYRRFWRLFGRVLKEGAGADDAEQRDRLVPLLLFTSSHDPEGLTSLADYASRMREGQGEIYYLTGDSRAAVERSPQLEALRAAGIEVLYLTDPVDEFLVETLGAFDGRPLRSAAKGAVEVGSEEERARSRERLEAARGEFAPLLGALGKGLAEWVREVRLSTRLVDSPVCLVGGEGDLSPQLERLLRQAEGALTLPPRKRILELNPDHPAVRTLAGRLVSGDTAGVADAGYVLLCLALLAEGAEIPEPGRFSRLVATLLEDEVGRGDRKSGES